MPLDETRLSNKIKAVLNQTRQETDDADASRDALADDLAKAIVEEIKELTIIYTTGLTAPSGPVTGSLTGVTIQ